MFARPGASLDAATLARVAAYEDKVFESAKLAKDKLQPARISYGTGVSYMNVQRDIIDPVTHRWWEGANYGGVSDKTVAVIKFEALNGDPIAVYYNYAMHAVITGTLDLVSGDAPGVHRDILKAISMTRWLLCGQRVQPAIRIRSTSNRHTICARSESMISQNREKTSAMRCRQADRDWTETILKYFTS